MLDLESLSLEELRHELWLAIERRYPDDRGWLAQRWFPNDGPQGDPSADKDIDAISLEIRKRKGLPSPEEEKVLAEIRAREYARAAYDMLVEKLD